MFDEKLTLFHLLERQHSSSILERILKLINQTTKFPKHPHGTIEKLESVGDDEGAKSQTAAAADQSTFSN